MTHTTGGSLPGGTDGAFRPTRGQIAGAVVAALLVIFIATNSTTVTATIVFFDVTMKLWLLLTFTALLGALVGFFLGKRRRQG
jgi:uncharacterized integral membrane protein